MVEINPLALINNPRFTPKIQDHSAIQKLLTDSYIQQSKNKAAAARGRQTVLGTMANRMMQEGLPISPQIAAGVGAPSLAGADISGLLSQARTAKLDAARAQAASSYGSAFKSQTDAGWVPANKTGTGRQLATGGGTATGVMPTARSIIQEDSTTRKAKVPAGSTTPVGLTDLTIKTGRKQKGSGLVGQTKNLANIIGNERWHEIARPLKRTADYLKMSVPDLIEKIQTGIAKADGSIQMRGTKTIVIDGQPYDWFN
tara:strand:- start:97 stop:867 length:771 start_codon:yes stop_codon:yes gene_type:complete